MPHVHFTFPEPLKKQLEKSVPFRERSLFVSLATMQALQRLRLKKVLSSKKYVGFYPDIAVEPFIRNLRKKKRKIKNFL